MALSKTLKTMTFHLSLGLSCSFSTEQSIKELETESQLTIHHANIYFQRPERIVGGWKEDFSRNNYRGKNLCESEFCFTNLENADFTDADLRFVNFTGANLRRANFTGANLRLADLTNADLRGANLTGADLTLALLENTDFREADITGVIYKI